MEDFYRSTLRNIFFLHVVVLLYELDKIIFTFQYYHAYSFVFFFLMNQVCITLKCGKYVFFFERSHLMLSPSWNRYHRNTKTFFVGMKISNSKHFICWVEGKIGCGIFRSGDMIKFSLENWSCPPTSFSLTWVFTE